MPSLGYEVLDWIADHLATPDRSEYERLTLTREQAQFVLNFYALDPGSGRRKYRRAVLSRPKGWGKSPILAAIACAEALGPVVPDGWDAAGEPVGRPWSLSRTPWVQLAAVSEDQTRNAWAPLLEMLREGPAIDLFPGLEPMETFVNLPKGRIEFVTSSATSREGNRPVFCVLDQTEEWKPSNGGIRLAATLRRNLGKTGGSSIESPNAFEPGGGSVSEQSAEYWKPQTARMYYLNQVTHASDAWLAQPEWAGCSHPDAVVADGDVITVGFDGSRQRARGVTDATALIGCRVTDGHLFELGVWEQPAGPAGDDWQVPTSEVDAAVRRAFDRFTVVGFYCDPARWEGYVAQWEAAYHKGLAVKASRDHPCEWWMTGGRATLIVRALEQFHSAVVDGELSHDGSFALTRHVLNARRRPSRSGIQVAKEHPDSARKIDAAIAAVLAWQARLDAVAAGADQLPKQRSGRATFV
jgi:hypothetical protein